ncbi:MAG: hypothetical protein WC312_07275 [Candidatus Omnitrophota bacterium]|jgi:hypothetical protein
MLSGAGPKIFWSFIILLSSVILLFLPITDGGYAFKTDSRLDSFTVVTKVATTANVTLLKSVYDADTSTISLSSNTSADSPAFTVYDSATHSLLVIGLAPNTVRTLEITYDVAAAGTSDYIATIIDKFANPIYLMIIILFPLVALVAIWWSR